MTFSDSRVAARPAKDRRRTAASGEAPRGAPPALGVSGYVERNRVAWDRWAPNYIPAARGRWQEGDVQWGIWAAADSGLHLLERLAPGSDVIELGCGTGAIPGQLALRGFRPVGVDIARPLLGAGARLQREFGVSFPLLFANAERLHYEDGTFDGVISEYGASLWCNPYRWVPEAYRLLRPGGRLIFFTSSPFLRTCTPAAGRLAGEQLFRDYFAVGATELPNEGAVEFHLTQGEWIRQLHCTGFVVEDLIETRPDLDATPRFDFATTEWARRWPTEEIWVARRPA